MTDKQIIIDVSDCSELCGTKCHILMSCTNSTKSDSCSEMPNCYYKQLKRKEQECERLRFPMPDTNYAILTKEEFEQLDQLKAENEILKEKLIISSNSDKKTLKIIQTLAEIKKIAEFDCSCGHNQMCICNVCDKFEQILQKISECEAGNE